MSSKKSYKNIPSSSSRNSLSSENSDAEFKSFNNKQSNDYYRESPRKSYSRKSYQHKKSQLIQNIVFFTTLFAIVIIVSMTSAAYVAKPLRNSEEIMEHINKVMVSFRNDLQKEREIILRKGDAYDIELKKSFSEFANKTEKKFAEKSELESKIESIKTKIKEIQNNNSQKSYDSEIKAMKDQISKINEKLKETKLSAEKAQKAQKNPENAKKIAENSRNIQNLLEKADSSQRESAGFITAAQLEKRLAELISGGLHEAMSLNRDGHEVNWANAYAGAYIASSGGRFKNIPMAFNTVTKIVLLSPIKNPGDCLAFKSSGGHVVISLRKEVIPTSFVYESVPLASNPSRGSGPKTVRASMETEDGLIPLRVGGKERIELKQGVTRQKIEFTDHYTKAQKIRFDFEENYGHAVFTCVYRILVHGKE